MKGKKYVVLGALVAIACVLALLGYLCDWDGVIVRYHFDRIDPARPLDRPSRRHVQGVISRGKKAEGFLLLRLIDISRPSDVAIAVLLLPRIPEIPSQTPVIRDNLEYALANTGATRMGSPIHFGPKGEPRGITWLRRNCVVALGDLRDNASIPLLVKALASPDWDTRKCAEKALQKMPAEAVYPHLAPLLEDGSRLYRFDKPRELQRVGDVAVCVVEALSGQGFGPFPAEGLALEEAAGILDERVDNCRQWLESQLAGER